MRRESRTEDYGRVDGLRRGDVQTGRADPGGQIGGEAGETGGDERGIIGPDCGGCNNIRTGSGGLFLISTVVVLQ